MGGGDPPDKNEVNLGKEGTKAFKFKGSSMTPYTADGSTLSGAGANMDKPKSTEYTVNAQFLQSDRETNQGMSYANGKQLAGGSSQPGWFYISSDGKGGYSFGQGDPASTSQNAVGGGRPLIIDGLVYGETNKYSNGKAPDKGPVDPANQAFLTQKSASYYTKQNSPTMGKTIVAYNPTSKEIMLIVQEHGTSGYNMDQLSSYLVKNGFTNALSFDGSDSSLLIKNKTTLVENGMAKDIYTNSGITFSVK